MKYFLGIALSILFITTSSAQYKTEYGDNISPKDTIFSLNLFINIVYDLCDTCDPTIYPETISTPNWEPVDTSELNDNPPIYLNEFMDREFDPNNIQGSFTKRYVEASFSNFIVLGDFININLPQSVITPVYTGNGFSRTEMMNAAFGYINKKGGVQTHYNHNNINDYDGLINLGPSFGTKSYDSTDLYIDLLQIFVRNSTDFFGDLGGGGNPYISVDSQLLIGGIRCDYNTGTIQGATKNRDLSNPPNQSSEIHELAHHLIGYTNSAHMGGGWPITSYNHPTLSFNNGGWSLIGSSNSSMVSCNGFERWRLNWRGPNNTNYRIACQGNNSDIEKGESRIFYLRDFVTTGDAVRIKLPYLDSLALNQYIWMENHQILSVNEDYPAYWELSCKDDGTKGVYAYYQIGKDIDSSSTPNTLITSIIDHLVPISAEGNWDIERLDSMDRPNCVNYDNQPIQNYYRENPLSGYNDLMFHFFNSLPTDTFTRYDEQEMLVKKKNGIIEYNLPGLGDNEDAFTNNSVISMGTNPSPASLFTYFNRRGRTTGTITKSSTYADNSRIHLSGLKIDFTEQATGIMKVDVRWDYYDIENPVLWTGDIVLHEKINMLSGSKITLDQNQTPNTHIRDTITSLFAGPTYFTCLDNSEFTMQSGSEVEVKNLGSFLIENGGSMEIKENAKFIVDESSTMLLENGANLTIGGKGYIKIQNAAYLCVESGANIELTDLSSKIFMHYSALNGVNSSVLPSSYSCVSASSSIPVTGLGRVIIDEHPLDTYIQNQTINATITYTTRNAYIGECVTTQKSFGDVIIESGSNVTVNASGEVFLDSGFEIEAGAVFTVL